MKKKHNPARIISVLIIIMLIWSGITIFDYRRVCLVLKDLFLLYQQQQRMMAVPVHIKD